MNNFVYTIRMPNKSFQSLFANYIDAIDWKETIGGEDVVLIHVDQETFNAVAILD